MKNPISLGVTLIRVPSVLKVLMNVGGDWIVEGGWGVGGLLSFLCASGSVCHWGACAVRDCSAERTHTEQLVCLK